MATISIHNLEPLGMDLFKDPDGYLSYISETEERQVMGGATPAAVFVLGLVISAVVGACNASKD